MTSLSRDNLKKSNSERTIVDTAYCSPTYESVLLCAFTALCEITVGSGQAMYSDLRVCSGSLAVKMMAA